MTAKFSPLDYAFAVGRIKALENYLVPTRIFREAAEAPGFSRAVELISEAGKSTDRLREVTTPVQLEAFLETERTALDTTLEELFLDKNLYGFYREADEIVKAAGSLYLLNEQFFLDFFRLKIDLANLKSFLRSRYAGHPVSQFEERYVTGGRLEKKTFIDNYNSNLEDFAQFLKTTSYEQLWREGLNFLQAQDSFVVFEREMENLVMDYLRSAKKVTFGPEPLFAYGLARRQELKLIRLVILGQMLNIPAFLLKERISQTYV
ncbi:MAG TPA: V-type ATPase subunit [Candidatus Saccharicenans sp.]|jgi:V/A-type H+-transporting ATPase subunit C|nr:V-type ATPase subunit [Candidatus Saccharicenans sp.]HRD01343.1 V-type ATPase subunit [Candidatus Saccharicenans sp.]